MQILTLHIQCSCLFFGVGQSGNLKYHGYTGFSSFSNMKSILVKPALDIFPLNIIYPPYTDMIKDQLIGILTRFGGVSQADIFRYILALVLWIVCLVAISFNKGSIERWFL